MSTLMQEEAEVTLWCVPSQAGGSLLPVAEILVPTGVHVGF